MNVPAPLFHILVALLSGPALVGGCGTGAAPSKRTVENDGEACLANPSDSDGSGGVEPGALRARVVFDTCLSSTCDEVQSKSCTAEVMGNTVVVTSRAEVLSQGGPCSADCGVVSTTCDVPALESGDYQLEHGDASQSFTLPSNDTICVGESP